MTTCSHFLFGAFEVGGKPFDEAVGDCMFLFKRYTRLTTFVNSLGIRFAHLRLLRRNPFEPPSNRSTT